MNGDILQVFRQPFYLILMNAYMKLDIAIPRHQRQDVAQIGQAATASRMQAVEQNTGPGLANGGNHELDPAHFFKKLCKMNSLKFFPVSPSLHSAWLIKLSIFR